MRVLTLTLHFEHIAVACFASLMAGKLHWAGANFGDRIPAIVTVLPEALWDHVSPDNQKNDESENKKARESK